MTTFKSEFEGTCALCWDSIGQGEELTTVELEYFGTYVLRHVHASCQRNFVESSPEDLRAGILSHQVD